LKLNKKEEFRKDGPSINYSINIFIWARIFENFIRNIKTAYSPIFGTKCMNKQIFTIQTELQIHCFVNTLLFVLRELWNFRCLQHLKPSNNA
jgi:hypothetical protein